MTHRAVIPLRERRPGPFTVSGKGSPCRLWQRLLGLLAVCAWLAAVCALTGVGRGWALPRACGAEAANAPALDAAGAPALKSQGAEPAEAEAADAQGADAGPQSGLASGDFRVVNEVFVGNQKEPASRSVTIFHQGVFYDFLTAPQEVLVFDPAHDRLVLLDLERRIRTELNTTQIEQFSQRQKQWASQQPDALLRFFGAPQFSEQFDEVRGELILSSPWLTYRILLADAPSPAVCQDYRLFCDWMARLSALLKADARPPFARLLLNEAIARHKAIPREVTLSIARSSLPLPPQVLRSTHRFYSDVVGPELDRVVQARQFMEIFKPVDFREYRQKIGH